MKSNWLVWYKTRMDSLMDAPSKGVPAVVVGLIRLTPPRGRCAGTKHLALLTGVVDAGQQLMGKPQGVELCTLVALQVRGVEVLNFQLGAAIQHGGIGKLARLVPATMRTVLARWSRS